MFPMTPGFLSSCGEAIVCEDQCIALYTSNEYQKELDWKIESVSCEWKRRKYYIGWLIDENPWFSKGETLVVGGVHGMCERVYVYVDGRYEAWNSTRSSISLLSTTITSIMNDKLNFHEITFHLGPSLFYFNNYYSCFRSIHKITFQSTCITWIRGKIFIGPSCFFINR